MAAVSAFAVVESPNIVGYTSTSMEAAKYMMYAPQFVDVKTEATALDSIMSNVPGVNWDEEGTFVNTATILQVFNGTTYNTYYYLNDGAISETETKAGWCDARGEITNVEIPVGQGFWVKPTTGAFTITFKKK